MASSLTAYALGVYSAQLKTAEFNPSVVYGLTGAGLGVLSGLISPDETVELDENNRKINKKHRLSSALSRGLLGGLTGATFGNFISKSHANNPAPPTGLKQSPPRPPVITPETPTKSEAPIITPETPTKPKTPASDLSPFTPQNPAPIETSADISLRPILEDVYKNAPGGLDAAVAAAQKHRNAAEAAGLITFSPEQLDTKIPVSTKIRDWIRYVPHGGLSANDTTADIRPSLGGMTVYDENWNKPKVLINPHSNMPPFEVLGHELSHAAFNPTDKNKVNRPITGAASLELPSSLRRVWNYVSDKSEFMAHLAEAKRSYVKQTGKQVNTPEDAMNVLRFMQASPNAGGTQLKKIVPYATQDKGILKQMLLQILSIVRGDSGRSNTGYA